MLDNEAARRIRQGAYAACALALALAAPASAQLIPATPPPTAGAESTTLGGDAAHRNEWANTGLRPPLEIAWQAPASSVQAAVGVGSRIVVETATEVVALSAADGSRQWSVPITRPVELAADSARVYLAGPDGVAALDAATGRAQWGDPDRGSTGPVVSNGVLITGNAAGELVGRATSGGAQLWRTRVGIAGARPAVAGLRAYASGSCRGASVDVLLGTVQWATGCAQDTGTRTLLTGALAISEDGPTFLASNGTAVAPAGGPGTAGAGLLFPNPIGNPAPALQARDAGSFGVRWTWDPLLTGVTFLRPAVIDATVWQLEATTDAGLVLAALDGASGAERWSGFVPGDPFPAARTSALAVAPGLLLVPTARALVALRNAPEGPLGVRATFPRNVVAIGERVPVTGNVVSDGRGLVGPRAVLLQADPFPFGARGYRTVGGAVSRPGGFEITTPIRRNSRLRLVSDGVVYPPAKVFALPRITVKYRATDVDLRVRATLRIAKAKGLRRAGRVALYRLPEGSLTAERIGAGRSRANGRARFVVTIPPDLSREDRVVPCLRRSSRRGFGAPNALDRRCGAPSITFGAQSSSAGLSLSTGTGSAMPLKRFMPASENE